MTDIGKTFFTVDHEWVRLTDSKTAVVGISDYGQSILSEATHIDLPEPDDQVTYEAGEELGVIESLRNSLPFHSPVSGIITKSNSDLLSAPEKITEDPFGEGWIFKISLSDPSEIAELLTAEEYDDHIPEDDED